MHQFEATPHLSCTSSQIILEAFAFDAIEKKYSNNEYDDHFEFHVGYCTFFTISSQNMLNGLCEYKAF